MSVPNISALSSQNTNLKYIAKILYDDLTFEVLNFILRQEPNKVEENLIAKSLCFNINLVRTSLVILKNDGLLICDEKKLKKDEVVNFNYTKNNNYVQFFEKNPDYMYYLEKKLKLLSTKIKMYLDKSKTQKYKCESCNEEYTEDKYAHYDHKCIKCHLELSKMIVDYDENIKQKSEIIMKELLSKFEGCKNEYNYQKSIKAYEGKSSNNKSGEVKQAANPLLRLSFDLNNYEVIGQLNNVDFKNENQFKAFKELVMIHTSGNINPN